MTNTGLGCSTYNSVHICSWEPRDINSVKQQMHRKIYYKAMHCDLSVKSEHFFPWLSCAVQKEYGGFRRRILVGESESLRVGLKVFQPSPTSCLLCFLTIVTFPSCLYPWQTAAFLKLSDKGNPKVAAKQALDHVPNSLLNEQQRPLQGGVLCAREVKRCREGVQAAPLQQQEGKSESSTHAGVTLATQSVECPSLVLFISNRKPETTSLDENKYQVEG